MARVKGCTNAKCVANKKKITYKETEDFCSKCGNPLTYVCKKCYTPIGKKDKLCARHLAEKEDKKDKAKKTAGQAGGVAAAVGAVVLAKGKDIVKYIPKLK